MVGWHHRLNGHEFQQALGDGEEEGRLACCSPWGCKVIDRVIEQQCSTLKEMSYLAMRRHGGNLVAQVVKNWPAMQENQVQSLGSEAPVGKGMATHSSILAWRIPWTEEPDCYSPWDCKESDMTEQLTH